MIGHFPRGRSRVNPKFVWFQAVGRARLRQEQAAGEWWRFRVESQRPDCMLMPNGSHLARETYRSLFIMKTRSLIYRILITVGVILFAPGFCFAQTNEWRQLFNGKD